MLEETKTIIKIELTKDPITKSVSINTTIDGKGFMMYEIVGLMFGIVNTMSQESFNGGEKHKNTKEEQETLNIDDMAVVIGEYKYSSKAFEGYTHVAQFEISKIGRPSQRVNIYTTNPIKDSVQEAMVEFLSTHNSTARIINFVVFKC